MRHMTVARLVAACWSILLITGWSQSAYAVDDKLARNTLRGITEVAVIVNFSSENVFVLSREALQTAVELRLREHGIQIVEVGTDTKEYVTAGRPALFVELGQFEVKRLDGKLMGLVIYSLDVHLSQVAMLVRNNELAIVDTWSVRDGGFMVRSVYLEASMRMVLEYVDKFLNAYLAANPKTGN